MHNSALSYDAQNRLATVTDSSGRVALTLSYDLNGKLSKVTDAANRTIVFDHDGDDLAAAHDVLGQVERYGYSARHKLTSRTDKNGGLWTELYDEDGRWVGMADPAGNRMQVLYDPLANKAVVIDRTGLATTWEWNAAGNPVKVTSPIGEVKSMSWDGSMNKLTEADGRGATWTYGYDAKGNLTSRKDPLGYTVSSTYDPTYSRLTYTSQPATNNTYDAKGNLLSSRDNNGNTTTYVPDTQGRPTTIIQPGSAVTVLGYDGQGNVATITDPEGGVTTLGQDAAGHLTSVTDGNGSKRTLEVDARGQVTAMVDALKQRTEYGYDALGNRTSIKDAAGAVTTFTYDALNRLTSTRDAKGNVTRTEYDAEGRVTARVDAKGNRSEVHYDQAGRLSETVSPDGAITSLGYCADQGQACETVDPLGRKTTIATDLLGRETGRTDPLGHLNTRDYLTNGLPWHEVDANGNTTTNSYDSLNRLSGVTQPQGYVGYGYDARGNRTSVTAGSSVTGYSYDKANRLLTEVNALKQATSYSYDKAGNRETKTDGNGKVTTYQHDANRRLKAAIFQDGSQYSYDYDSRGNRTLEKGPSHERHLKYDALNRLEQVDDVTLGKIFVHGYDANGNRTTTTVDGLSFGYRYDKLNRLVEVVEPDGEKTRLFYDLAGNRERLVFGNGVTASYEYDAAGRLTLIAYADAQGRPLQSFKYDLDAVGNRLNKTFLDGTVESYSYDAGNRLIKVSYPGGRTVTYTLDALGNRTLMVEQPPAAGRQINYAYTTNAFNQVTQVQQYDYVNPIVTTAYAYDGNGNLKTETQGTSVRSYVYDLDNRLMRIDLPGGAANVFEYDANGLRTKKLDSSGTTRYLLDGPSVVAEYDDLGTRKAFYVNNPQRIDEVFSTTLLFNGQPTKVYPLTDGLGSVYALVDRNGAVVRTNSYDVYGSRTTSGTGPVLAMGFTGREHERDWAGTYHRDRYLQSVIGTWMQPDRLGIDADGPPLYQYARNAPTTHVDPSGKITLLGGLLLVLAMVAVLVIFQMAANWIGENIDFENLKRLRPSDEGLDPASCRSPLPTDPDATTLTFTRLNQLASAADTAQVTIVDFSQSRESSERGYIGRARGNEILLSVDLFRTPDTRLRRIAFIAEVQHVAGLRDEAKAQAELLQLLDLMGLGPLPEGWQHGPKLHHGY